MARYRTQESAKRQIAELKEKIERTKRRVKEMEKELQLMVNSLEVAEAKSLYEALQGSGKTYEQTISFLKQK